MQIVISLALMQQNFALRGKEEEGDMAGQVDANTLRAASLWKQAVFELTIAHLL